MTDDLSAAREAWSSMCKQNRHVHCRGIRRIRWGEPVNFQIDRRCECPCHAKTVLPAEAERTVEPYPLVATRDDDSRIAHLEATLERRAEEVASLRKRVVANPWNAYMNELEASNENLQAQLAQRDEALAKVPTPEQLEDICIVLDAFDMLALIAKASGQIPDHIAASLGRVTASSEMQDDLRALAAAIPDAGGDDAATS